MDVDEAAVMSFMAMRASLDFRDRRCIPPSQDRTGSDASSCFVALNFTPVPVEAKQQFPPLISRKQSVFEARNEANATSTLA